MRWKYWRNIKKGVLQLQIPILAEIEIEILSHPKQQRRDACVKLARVDDLPIPQKKNFSFPMNDRNFIQQHSLEVLHDDEDRNVSDGNNGKRSRNRV